MLYDFLAGNFPISLIILALAGTWAYRSRSSIRLAMNDTSGFWRAVSRVGVVTIILFFVWVTVLDNWRQLLAYIVITGRDYASDPFETAATPELLRIVSLALLATSIVSLALVYARHMGSYAFLIITLLFAPVFVFTFNEIRISADAFLRLSETALESPGLLDAGSIIFWSTGMFVIIAAVVLGTYLMFLAAVALPARIIYGIIEGPKHEKLARVFESYERRARDSRRRHGGAPPGDSGLNQDAPANS